MPTSSLVAAVDLGSNSFHMVIARVIDEHHLQVIDKLRERVQLAAGLDDQARLSEDAQARALSCLRRFNQLLESFRPEQVRVIGTNTLRQAANGAEFREKAAAALGRPIEVVSGQEEARLVYLGVLHDSEDDGARRLVVDIGGGSTECIIGEGPELLRADSLYMGCIGYTRRFFPDGRITADAMERAITAARLELGPVQRLYRNLGWARAYGSSGTIDAVQTILDQSNWTDHCITPDGLDQLRDALIAAGHADALNLPGLKADRAPVIAGGLAVLCGVFRSLHIEEMVASDGALREGALYDLLGRQTTHDVRQTTIARLRERYGVDQSQATRVERVAAALGEQARAAWELSDEDLLHLRWAAQIHEIGQLMAYTGHHRHAAYIVANSNLPGFSRGAQAFLAAVVLAHRRAIVPERVAALVGGQMRRALRLALLLRIAVVVNRTRSPSPRPKIKLDPRGDRVQLTFPPGWLAERPLSRADLETEALFLAPVGFTLSWT